VIVERALGDFGSRGDLVDADAGEAAAEEQPVGSVDDAGARSGR
jgi:hypothetical protein